MITIHIDKHEPGFFYITDVPVFLNNISVIWKDGNIPKEVSSLSILYKLPIHIMR